uniref:Uncharacterized protein n=1 Tax=Cyclopterus lumpus TaxID=8103 RepID=A0A8C3AWA1_CYCLU
FISSGPVKFSSECRTHFHRLYHNTRDCSRPACMYAFASLVAHFIMCSMCFKGPEHLFE